MAGLCSGSPTWTRTRDLRIIRASSIFMLFPSQKFFHVARLSAGYVDTGVYDVYYAIMTSKELIALLNQDGWTLRGSKGSHHVFVHPSKAGYLTVSYPKKDLGTGLVQ